MFVGQSAGVGKTGRIAEVRKKTKKEDKGNCAVFQRKIDKI